MCTNAAQLEHLQHPLLAFMLGLLRFGCSTKVEPSGTPPVKARSTHLSNRILQVLWADNIVRQPQVARGEASQRGPAGSVTAEAAAHGVHACWLMLWASAWHAWGRATGLWQSERANHECLMNASCKSRVPFFWQAVCSIRWQPRESRQSVITCPDP